MRLFEKMTKILKDNNLAESYADYVIDDYKSVKVKLEKWHEISSALSKTRKKNQKHEREKIVWHLIRILSYLENSLDEFEYDYIDLCHLLKLNPNLQLTHKVSKKVEFAISTKNELRKEFETIYKNFKNMAKKFDDIPMKEILKLMREVFDFEGTKQNEESEYVQKKYLANRYWDSTSMTFRQLR